MVKLKSKILWISSLAIVIASLMVGSLILRMAGRDMKNAAVSENGQSFLVMVNELTDELPGSMAAETKNLYLDYFFKSQRDDMNICLKETENTDGQKTYESIYNHTSLSGEMLQTLNYKSGISDSIEYAYAEWEGQEYIVFHRQIWNQWQAWQLVSLQETNAQIHRLTWYMCIIIFGVTALVICFLFLILGHLLQPLQALTKTTQKMAAGEYGHRLTVRRKDELGQLEDSFNKMAEAMENSIRRLEESEKKKTLFMGNLTHELKTPMTAISGYAQTLLTTKLSQENQEAALYYIDQECTRLERLSKKMMMLLELDQDTEIVLADTPVEKIFRAAARSCERLLKEKQITLECIQHGEHFQMDEDLMTDLLINLIDNGIKASEGGSRIILQAGENGIEVIDFGKGIPAQEQKKILEPFYMVDKSRSRKNGGAGLGLALSALIARKHHITMHIESREGEGTRINLQFV